MMTRSLKRGKKKRRSTTSANKQRTQKGRGFKKPPIYSLVETLTLGMLKGMGMPQKGRGLWSMSNALFNPKLAEALAQGMGLKKTV